MRKIETPELLQLAIDAAYKAGDQILKIYESEEFGVLEKEDNSPLTKADKASHDVIVEHLKDTNIPVLSEEGSNISYEERSKWELFWMIDPLDGTKEFIKKNGEFTVNIALIEKGNAILGVVYAPVLGKLYHGVKGSGSYLIKPDKSRSILSVSKFHPSQENLRVVASRSHLNSETSNFLEKLNDPAKVSMGSSLKFLVVAEGMAEYYPRYAPTMEWDTAAAQIILEEAGGFVRNMKGQKLIYNKENLLNPYFLAGGEEIRTY